MTTKSLLFWAPRILCILAILFVSIFALDSFTPQLPVGQQILAFLIHLIPSYILTALLVIAWKWELTGGVLFTIVGIVFSYFVFTMNFNRTYHDFWGSFFITLFIAFPFVVVGILFIIGSHRRGMKL